MKNHFAPYCLLTLLLSMVLLSGCESRQVQPDRSPTPLPTYTGPEFLHTTIGSMVALRGYGPALVSGYGLVTQLPGTGSADVPPQLRQYMLQQISRGGFGATSLGTGNLSPQRVLASETTAVVLVQGIVPPGATPGTRFDLYVTALPQTQTTSLESGLLYTTQLYPGSPIAGVTSAVNVADGRGRLFLNPFTDQTSDPLSAPGDERTGRIIGGGIVAQPTRITLRLNQPSYQRARQISDRINARIPQAPEDPRLVAQPQSDSDILLNIPKRYQDEPEKMLGIISHLFIDARNSFNQQKARELRDFLAQPENRRYREDVALSWVAMGRLVIPFLRDEYENPNLTIRTAALYAGARLGDVRTARHLYALASSGDISVNQQAAADLRALITDFPPNTSVLEEMRKLLDAEDVAVRMEAVRALTAASDRTINIRRFNRKFDLVLVRSQRPMVYVTQEERAQIVVFNENLPLIDRGFFMAFDGRLMIRGETDQRVLVRYQPAGRPAGEPEAIPATVGNLIYLLGTEPEPGVAFKDKGFDLSYSQVVKILYHLHKEKWLGGPFVLQSSDYLERITRTRLEQTGIRSEGGDSDSPTLRPDDEMSPDNEFRPDNELRPDDEPMPEPRDRDADDEVIELYGL